MEASVWHTVEDRRCYGVVIYNFDGTERNCPYGITAYLGESVLIKGECKNWYYVRKFDSDDGGIIPKTYIRILDCTVIRNGESEVVIPKIPTLAQEINAALREWHKISKKLFVCADKFPKDKESGSQETAEPDSQTFTIMEQMIIQLHECRKRVMSSNLTVENLKDLKKQVARIIDTGNNLLKLDMVVRDENGNPLDPKTTSTIELFRQHQKSSHKLRKHGRGANRGSRIFYQSSHSLLVTLEKISWRIVDECEVRFYLYDGKDEVPFTESVQCTFTAGTVPKLPVKMLFTDLGKSDLERTKVYLVAYVVRIGAMEFKDVESKKDNSSAPFSGKPNNIQVRRPYGVAAKDVTYLFRENAGNNNINELQTMFYMPCGSDDTLDSTLQKIKTAELASNNGKDPRAVGLLLRFSMISGTTQPIHEEQPFSKRNGPITARKMGFPEVIYPNDVRNDLYINLMRGEFYRSGAKSSDKNIEVSVSVHDDRGRLLREVISGGNGSPSRDPYKSVVYYHEDKPKWNEYFKITLPMNIEEFSSAHIRFTFKHRSSTDSKDRSERPFALAYLRLKEVEGTAVKDGIHDLIVYKVDPKHFKESEVEYLSLPYERTPNWQVTAKPACPAGFSCVPKDCFFIRTTLCSTKFTQDADLLGLLQWVTKLKHIAESTPLSQTEDGQRQLIPALLLRLKEILQKVQKVDGAEIVKFLTDVFDALFSILVDPVDSILTELRSGRASIYGSVLDSSELRKYELGQMDIGTCDRPVFDCLIYIFGLILDHKYQNFQSVLSIYIEDGFFSTLAYKKLTKELEKAISTPDPSDNVLRIMKSIEFFFKFIIRSFEHHKRVLLMELGGGDDCEYEGNEEFDRLMDGLFHALRTLLSRRDNPQDPYILAEGGCLKHIPAVITDIIHVYAPRRLSEHLVELVLAIPQGKLTKQKLQFITDIIHSEIFLDPECRFLLLPIVTSNIQQHLPGSDEELRRKSMETQQHGSHSKLEKIFGTPLVLQNVYGRLQPPDNSNHFEETEKCVELLGDVLDIFHRQPHEQKKHHICYIMQILLRPIIMSIGTIGDNDPLAGNMVAIFLSLLREMNSYQFEILTILINSLKAERTPEHIMIPGPPKQSLLKFLNDVLVVLKNLFHKSYFPPDWNEMVLLQNSVVIGAFEHFAATVKAEFVEPFEEQPWNNFFQSAVSFLIQDSLQLEEFSQAKRSYITQNYGDMRKRATELIRQMWFSLGESKRIRFVPMMVGTFLDMAFVPESELRKSTIPIFFDMMHCEFDQERPRRSFEQVEEELIRKVVEGFEGGKGDVEFRDIFYETMYELCQNNRTGFRDAGITMVVTITKLMDLLLQYREVMYEEDSGNRMSCINNLLDFSQEINRKDLYLRYLYKLHDLHVQAGNFTEAAFTLKLHSRQLEWSDDEIPITLRTNPNRHASLITQTELKETLYHEIIEYFSKAKMFECALEICDELRQQYSEEMYNYAQLPSLLQKMATFYDRILKETRFEPNYFRVAFYGKEFPSFLQDKAFVYRGGAYERLGDFETRMLERYPRAELLRSLGLPSDDVRYSNKQYLQICSVEPVMNTNKRISGMKYADENIRKYYKVNEVEKFMYQRPYHQEPRDPDNEFASLWLDRYTLWTTQSFPGIMGWFPVERQMASKIPPILNATETLEKNNEKLREMVLSHCLNNDLNVNPLSMKLNGILDAAVMGGVSNYEKAFLTPEYLERHPDELSIIEELKRLVTCQVPIIAECLKIHGRKSSSELKPLHKRLEESFEKFERHIEEFYGVNRRDLRDDALRREMERALKKQQIVKPLAAPKETVIKLDPHSAPRGSIAIGRSIGSFSSTISLYQNHPKICRHKSQKSMGYFKRASQSSFSGSMDGDQLTVTTPQSATLPRNGGNPFFPTKLSPVDSTNEGKTSQELLIPLTETRPPRSHAEQRKSQSWTASGDSRSSIISMNSLDFPRPNAYPSEPGSRTSVNSPDSAIDTYSSDETAPPLPPKQRDKHSENKPPTPPPKPPMRFFRDVPQP
ncbi:unnamed protein product [Orchesella dallaii]|uniref:Dedicator of cytokinesis protein 1 n=1 Tax=Orchesella dallaii TaxID=48710 RepID=A0ABP1PYE5_9HEXA